MVDTTRHILSSTILLARSGKQTEFIARLATNIVLFKFMCLLKELLVKIESGRPDLT